MRPFEILLLLANLLAFLLLAVPVPRARRWAWRLALAAPLAAVVQVIAEGWRWQLIPAYALAALVLLIWVKRRISPVPSCDDVPRRSRLATKWTIGLGGLGLVFSGLLPLVFPVFHFPPPGGPYGIGTVTYHWVDSARAEIFRPSPAARRELLVQVWYPARQNPAAPRTPYLPDAGAVMGALACLQHLPVILFTHFRFARTNAVADAPVDASAARYPVLVFLEGVTGFRQMNTYQVEELVSRGYIVAALDQPGIAAAVVFPGGRQAVGLPVAQLRSLIRASYVPEDHLRLGPGQALDNAGIVPYLAEDVRFVLDRLTALNQADPTGPLTGRMDLSKIGVFGVSLGGIVAAEACYRDARLRACLVLDAPMPTVVARAGLRQPTMWLTRAAETMRLERQRAGGWPENEILAQQTSMRAVYQRLRGAGYIVQVRGAFHSNFMDLPTWMPLASWVGLAGPIDGQRAHNIINAYSVAFFNQHLQGRRARLLAGTGTPYPEVHFEARRPNCPAPSSSHNALLPHAKPPDTKPIPTVKTARIPIPAR